MVTEGGTVWLPKGGRCHFGELLRKVLSQGSEMLLVMLLEEMLPKAQQALLLLLFFLLFAHLS